MRTRSSYFVDQHNNLSAWKKRNEELEQIEPVRMLKNATEVNLNKLPLTEGMVHFIRQVDGGGQINLLNEVFEVGTEFTGEYVWATHSRLQPIINKAKSVKKHWDGIMNYHDSRITNGLLEGLNSIVQFLKRSARGCRNPKNFMIMIYLRLGKLEFNLPT